jgi:protein OS-9
MATTDTIVFVKESRTCAYVLVVHTPRLCGVPGFRSSTDSREQASISCREVVPAQPPLGAPSLPNADRPLAKITRRKTVLPPPLPAKDKASAADKGGKYTDAIRRALQALRGNAADIELLEDDDGGFVIQLLDDLPAGAEGEDNLEAAAERGADRIAHFLRDAGIDVQNVQMAAALTGTPKTAAAAKKKKKKNGDEKQEADDAADQRREVNEL